MAEQIGKDLALLLLQQAFDKKIRETDAEEMEKLIEPSKDLFGLISKFQGGISAYGKIPDADVFQKLVLQLLQENPVYDQIFNFIVQRTTDQQRETRLSFPPVLSQLLVLLRELDLAYNLVIDLHQQYNTELYNSNRGFPYEPQFSFQGTELQKYLNIGKEIRDEVSQFVSRKRRPIGFSDQKFYLKYKESFEILEKLPAIARKADKINEKGCPPFFAICSSSGTGKTQLPFTLDVPLLYFVVYQTGESQTIYGDFDSASAALETVSKNDYQLFTRGFSDKQLDDLENFTATKLFNFTKAFETSGFLVDLIVQISNLKKGNPDEPWAKLQLHSSISINRRKLSIKDARIQLVDCFEKHPELFEKCQPLIFLDEFNISQKSDSKRQGQYVFLKNMIRALLLIPVLMGTNTNISNMITTGSPSGHNHREIWCYLFVSLPKTPLSFIQKEIKSLSASIENSDVNNQKKNFLENIKPFMIRERPFFVIEILDFLKDKLKRFELKESSSMCEFIVFLFCCLSNAFRKRKQNHLKDFHRCQICYFENEYTQRLNPGEYPELIRQHLAYLSLPKDGEAVEGKGILVLERMEKRLEYQINRDTQKAYEMKMHYPGWNEEPLTMLSFTGFINPAFKEPRNSLFSYDSGPTLYTAYQAVYDLYQKKHKEHPLPVTKFSGTFLEIVFRCSFLLSTRFNGLLGGKFREWFPNFIFQLSDSKSNTAEKVDFEGDTSVLEEIFIGCASPNATVWSNDLKSLIGNEGNLLNFSCGTYKTGDSILDPVEKSSDDASRTTVSTMSFVKKYRPKKKSKDSGNNSNQPTQKIKLDSGAKNEDSLSIENMKEQESEEEFEDEEVNEKLLPKKLSKIVGECKFWDTLLYDCDIENILKKQFKSFEGVSLSIVLARRFANSLGQAGFESVNAYRLYFEEKKYVLKQMGSKQVVDDTKHHLVLIDLYSVHENEELDNICCLKE